MAEGRMLKKRLSKSEKLAALPSDSPRLLYYMIYPHIDVEGRHEADPIIIKGQCVPYLKTFTIENIQTYLKQLHEVGLIILWEINGYQYLQITRFHDHNRIDREKEAKSLIPSPPKDLRKLQSKSGESPEFICNKSSQSNVSLSISQREKPDLNCKFDLLQILKDTPLKEKDSLIAFFCKGLKERGGRCYDPEKCKVWFKDLLDKAVSHKPENLYGYLHASFKNFHEGKGYKP